MLEILSKFFVASNRWLCVLRSLEEIEGIEKVIEVLINDYTIVSMKKLLEIFFEYLCNFRLKLILDFDI